MNPKLKEALQRDVDALSQARDELLVQLSLAKAEARDDWRLLEDRWLAIQSEIKRTIDHSKETGGEVADSVRALLDELKHGYTRIKAQLKDGARPS